MKYRYGICIGYKDIDKVKLMREYGYDFVETGFAALSKATDAEIYAFADALKENGLTCSSMNGFIPSDIKVVGTDMDDKKINAYLEETFEKTAILGGKSVIFGSGEARKIPDGYDRTDAKRDLLHFLRDLALPYAIKYGIVIGIEELNEKETNVINTCAEAMEYVREVNDPHVRLNVDYYHVVRMNEPVSSIADYKGFISHVHIASPSNNRVYPLPCDGDDYGELYRVLAKADYKAMNISLEGGDGHDFVHNAKSSIDYLKKIESENA